MSKSTPSKPTAKVIATLTPDAIRALQGELAALEAGEQTLLELADKAEARIPILEKEIRRFKMCAIALKFVGMVCSGLIMFSVVPSLNPYIAFTIFLAASGDLALGVRGGLTARLKSKHETERLLEFLDTIEDEVMKTLRAAGVNADAAIRGHVDALTRIIVAARKSVAAAREAFRQWDLEHVDQLKPTEVPALPSGKT